MRFCHWWEKREYLILLRRLQWVGHAQRGAAHRRFGTGASQAFDDVKIWLDNDANGTLDAGDDVQVDDDFSSATLASTYDAAGNLTSDGVLGYVYDAWNRLVQVQRAAAGDTTTIATYAYDGQHRRVSKTVTHSGPEVYPDDGGETVVHYYYDNRWRIVETRNGSYQTTRQWVWAPPGAGYVDEVILMDVNADPGIDNDSDPDTETTAESTGHASDDSRYFYQQDRNWNVVALTEYDPESKTNNGRIVERYAYTPYGERTVVQGNGGSGELACVLPNSPVGNPLGHQGLPLDAEKGTYQNRWRDFSPTMMRYCHRDPIGFRAGPNVYVALHAVPTKWVDPRGQLPGPVIIGGIMGTVNCTCCEQYTEPAGTGCGPDVIVPDHTDVGATMTCSDGEQIPCTVERTCQLPVCGPMGKRKGRVRPGAPAFCAGASCPDGGKCRMGEWTEPTGDLPPGTKISGHASWQCTRACSDGIGPNFTTIYVKNPDGSGGRHCLVIGTTFDCNVNLQENGPYTCPVGEPTLPPPCP